MKYVQDSMVMIDGMLQRERRSWCGERDEEHNHDQRKQLSSRRFGVLRVSRSRTRRHDSLHRYDR